MSRPVAALILAALIIAASAPRPASQSVEVPVWPRQQVASVTTDWRTGAPQPEPVGADLAEPGGAPLPAAPTTEPSAAFVAAEPTPAPTSAISWIVDGIASTYGPGWDGRLALPAGRGIRVRICGPAACAVRVSNDAGPDLAMQRKGRIVDLDVPTFELVCGCGWRRGLVRVTVEGL